MRINFKNQLAQDRFWYMSYRAMSVCIQMAEWCWVENIPFVVTDTATTIKEDELVGRKSDTHRTGRSFDVSIRGWSKGEIDKFINYFSELYKPIAATNDKGDSVLIPDINHGTAPHIHVQIHRRFAVKTGLE